MSGSFAFDGRSIPFEDGDTVASALLRAEIVAFRRSLGDAPRGLYCGIGLCFECELVVDGVPARACQEPARESTVERGGAWRS